MVVLKKGKKKTPIIFIYIDNTFIFHLFTSLHQVFKTSCQSKMPDQFRNKTESGLATYEGFFFLYLLYLQEIHLLSTM